MITVGCGASEIKCEPRTATIMSSVMLLSWGACGKRLGPNFVKLGCANCRKLHGRMSCSACEV